MIWTHSFAGVLTSDILSKSKEFSLKQRDWILAVGITSAVLPDLDFLLMFFTGSDSHHIFFTHTPIFYLICGLILSLGVLYFEKVLKKDIDYKFIDTLILTFIINTLVHIFLDVPTGKIRLLWPMNESAFTIFPINIAAKGMDWIANYITNPMFYFEIMILIVGSILSWKIFRNKEYIISKITLLFWIFVTTFMSAIIIN